MTVQLRKEAVSPYLLELCTEHSEDGDIIKMYINCVST